MGRTFFQFNFTYPGDIGAERVMGWGHSALIHQLTHFNVSLLCRWDVLLCVVIVLPVRHRHGIRLRLVVLRSCCEGAQYK